MALWLTALTPVFAFKPPVANPSILVKRYEMTGENEADLVSEAMLDTVRSAAGRIYFTELMLRARNILDAYLAKNVESFVTRHEIFVSEVRGGQRFLDVEVTVDVRALYERLHTMKFFYRPEFRPFFYAFVAETFDGDLVTAPVGRKRLLKILGEGQYRYLWDKASDDPGVPLAEKKEVRVRADSPTPDVTPETDMSDNLMAACREAQRHEVEVFITGKIETKTTSEETVYFDKYFFVKTYCELKLVRSDTGLVLASAHTTTAAGHVDQAKAIQNASEAAVADVTPKLLGVFDKQWGKTILADNRWGKQTLRKSNVVKIMTVGADAEMLGLLRRILAGVASDAEVYTLTTYADIAVLTLSWNGKTEELLALLHQTQHPGFTLTVAKPNGLILELK